MATTTNTNPEIEEALDVYNRYSIEDRQVLREAHGIFFNSDNNRLYLPIL